MSATTTAPANPQWTELLHEAVTVPGNVSEAYQRFHNYSFGNQILAMWQCKSRNIAPGPLGTFKHWQKLGRNVRKGEKALHLCMPVTGKRTAAAKDAVTGEPTETQVTFMRYVYRNHWFVLGQTDGSEYVPAALPEWNEVTALAALDISRTEFASTNGNALGYAKGRTVSISPLDDSPASTLFHEVAHIVLGHTAEGKLEIVDPQDRTPRNIRELEAECVAMLCCASLGLPGVELSRGYIQNWFRGNEVPERSAQKIFNAADKILKAGVIAVAKAA